MIVYSGLHYMAYFYSEKHDTWLEYNDSTITNIGNWSDVIINCIE